MARRHHHYERAFEQYLRARRIPYVATNETRQAPLPPHATPETDTLKSFDFLIYGADTNLLADIKGRKILHNNNLENWVTEDDVAHLQAWARLFGPGFEPVFLFVYWCDHQPPDALYQEVFEHDDRWYALRAINAKDYQRVMKPRSPRWRTVHVPKDTFESLSQPFAPRISQTNVQLGLPTQLPTLTPPPPG